MLYVGLDVHTAATALTIRNAEGAIIARDVIVTTREAFRSRFSRLRGRMRVVCEAGPLAGWVSVVLTTRAREVVICDPRQNALILRGTKTDRVDADKLSELLRLNALRPVFLGDEATRELRRLVWHFLSAQNDRRRNIHRLHSIFRSLGIGFEACVGRPERVPLRRLRTRSSRFIAHALLEEIARLKLVIEAAREQLLEHAAQHPAFHLLQTIPYVGKMRAAELIAIVGVPHRFKSLRKFWAYAGLAVVRRSSAEHWVRRGRPVRRQVARGLHLNRNRHLRLKRIFRDIALFASLGRGEFRVVYDQHIARGKEPSIARIALARKVASIVRAVWCSGCEYDPSRLQIGQQFGPSIDAAVRS